MPDNYAADLERDEQRTAEREATFSRSACPYASTLDKPYGPSRAELAE